MLIADIDRVQAAQSVEELKSQVHMFAIPIACNRLLAFDPDCFSYQGFDVVAAQCDVRVRSDVDAAVQAAVKQFGGLDIVVANAGALWMVDPVNHRPGISMHMEMCGNIDMDIWCFNRITHYISPHDLRLVIDN